ncbi:MAG: cell wall-binding repeat-containing protein [Peptacetobacter hiranonis]|nr:cell wall-binding repeat-containing protein [Peptacetobacter hiranonis]
MNKNRNKVAAMMMIAAITVSSVAMPVEAAVSSVESVEIERGKEINTPVEEVRFNENYFEDPQLREVIKRKLPNINDNDVISQDQLDSITEIEIGWDEGNPNNDFYSLKGIEHFPMLEKLSIYGCKNLKDSQKVDLSQNKQLKTLSLVYCGLESIELSENDALTYVSITSGNLKKLDLSDKTKLTRLDCFGNENLIELKVPSSIKDIDASGGILSEINLKDCNELVRLNLSGNKITELDLSNKENLDDLDANNNQLEKINLEGTNNITQLFLEGNNLNKIDLSKCEMLSYVYLKKNELSYLNLSNNKHSVRLRIDENKIGYVEGNKSTIIESGNKQEIYIDVDNNDKVLNLDTYFPGIDMNKVTVQTKGVTKNGTKLEWKGKVPSRIRYDYFVGGKNDNQILNVHLILSTVDDGGSGGGTTTPDQKPDQKPDEKPNKPNKPGNITSKIVGKNRYETAAKIADELVKNNVSYNSVILVNSDKSMADGLSAASLSGKKNAPILLVKKDSIPTEAMAKIEKAKNVYIIGGEGAISKKVENQLKGKNITRISGKDRYETSAKIANMLGGYKMAFIVNGAKGEADAMSVSSVAAKYGAPILLTNGKTSTHPIKAGVSYFVIGGRGVVSNQLADKYNADRIAGVDRYSTNRKVIDEFYYDSKKVYFAKGDTLVDALTASLLAKENGMVLVSKNANHKKLEGKEAVQVGGMDFEISFE